MTAAIPPVEVGRSLRPDQYSGLNQYFVCFASFDSIVALQQVECLFRQSGRGRIAAGVETRDLRRFSEQFRGARVGWEAHNDFRLFVAGANPEGFGNGALPVV